MRRRDFVCFAARCVATCAAASLTPWAGLLPAPGLGPGEALAQAPPRELGWLGVKESPWFEALAGKAVRCGLCPRECELGPGERGYCRVRENRDGKLFTLVYGNPCALNVDPIEKKPFFHVLPGSASFSIATAGCNMDCKFCQNWEISQASPDDTPNYQLSPVAVAEMAQRYDCLSVASTYVEPTIFTEYMIDVGKEVQPKRMLNVMHSNGFIKAGPLDALCERLDAACVDLKGFTEEYYSSMTDGELAPVLAALRQLRRRGKHIELVTLLVPGRNDDMAVIRDMCAWVRDELGPDTPLHFSRFAPRYKLKSLPPTPLETLEKARETALAVGLRYVYLGNVPGSAGECTWCPRCNAELVSRVGYMTTVKALDLGKAACAQCGEHIPGLWTLPA